MAVRIKSITISCADPYRLAQFWSQLTGFTEEPDNGAAPGDPQALLLSPDGQPALLFIAGPKQEQPRNQVRLGLLPVGGQRDVEIDRLLGLGGRVVEDQRRPEGAGWVLLADPEGNEFCIERSDVEPTAPVEQLGRALAAVGELIVRIRPEQWPAPTPCTDWTVRRLVDHLIGMNRVFTALLSDEPPPPRRPPTTKTTPSAPTAIPQPGCRPPSSGPESSNATTAVRSGRPAVPNDCRSASTTSSPTAGTSPRPRGNPSSCLMMSPSSRWHSRASNLTDNARPGRFGPATDRR